VIAYVAVKDDVYSKTALVVEAGTKVRWTWRGDSLHDVNVTKGPEKFRSGKKKTGRFTHEMDKPGTYKLVCTVHAPDMKMTLTVR
jgi:plastocyanin